MLNVRQQRFVQEYVRSGNASEAYRIAYDTDNAPAANAAAARLLANVSVREAVETARRESLRRLGLTADRWAEEVALLAFSDVVHYGADRQGKLTSTGPPGSTRAVSSVEVTRVTTGRGADRRTRVTTRVKLWPKAEALRMAGQALDILKGKLELSGSVGRPDLEGVPDASLDAIESLLSNPDPDGSAGGEGPPPAQ